MATGFDFSVEFFFKTLAALATVISIKNSVAIHRDRRRWLKVAVLSHFDGSDDRGAVKFRITNPSRHSIRIRTCRLLARDRKTKKWEKVEGEPEQNDQTADLPIELPSGHSQDLHFSPESTLVANVSEQFYVEVETELDECFRSQNHRW